MKYFRTLPSILQPNLNSNYTLVTNIITRAYLLPSLQNNVYLYYDYQVKDYDKPESISYKFYNDQYRYWMILYANNIFDVQEQWPRDFTNFIIYLSDKYSSEASNANTTPINYTKTIIHHYDKIITTYNDVDNVKSTITIQIDANTYNNTVSSIQTNTLPDGSVVTKLVSKSYATIYDYELDQNEKKREIKLIKDVYAPDMESKLAALMKQ